MQARQQGTTGWQDFGSCLHCQAAKRLAEQLGLPKAMIETRDVGGRIWLHRVVQRVEYFVEDPIDARR